MHLFDDGVKNEIPSEIYQPLSLVSTHKICLVVNYWHAFEILLA